MLIYAPPAVLTLHLKRFEQAGTTLRRLGRHVHFTELLDLAPYCSRLTEVVSRRVNPLLTTVCLCVFVSRLAAPCTILELFRDV